MKMKDSKNRYIPKAKGFSALSEREVEVLQLIAEGKSFKTIGSMLIIAISTVANHASRIYSKLDVSRREDAISRYRQECSSPSLPSHNPETQRIVSASTLRSWVQRLARVQGGLELRSEMEALLSPPEAVEA